MRTLFLTALSARYVGIESFAPAMRKDQVLTKSTLAFHADRAADARSSALVVV